MSNFLQTAQIGDGIVRICTKSLYGAKFLDPPSLPSRPQGWDGSPSNIWITFALNVNFLYHLHTNFSPSSRFWGCESRLALIIWRSYSPCPYHPGIEDFRAPAYLFTSLTSALMDHILGSLVLLVFNHGSNSGVRYEAN